MQRSKTVWPIHKGDKTNQQILNKAQMLDLQTLNQNTFKELRKSLNNKR